MSDFCRDQDLGEIGVRSWPEQFKTERADATGKGQPLPLDQQRISERKRKHRQFREYKDLLQEASALSARDLK